ncbi:hypothetical protein KUCAC02_011898 [Chaenocephalus aceratus]|uniref:Uncharacterized protein n=1 Tax=Chaenocephalus aceratus TaxID=36190 RepID=A0ACB9X9T9_CHAAC|nr:hypothetical protein KUCAC02_011898 [Chaenocephalus aceratus]
MFSYSANQYDSAYKPQRLQNWGETTKDFKKRINPTGRSMEGLSRLKSWGLDPEDTGPSQPHRGSRNTDRLEDAGELDVVEQGNEDVRQDDGALSSE